MVNSINQHLNCLWIVLGKFDDSFLWIHPLRFASSREEEA
jgi:hypothetical protein